MPRHGERKQNLSDSDILCAELLLALKKNTDYRLPLILNGAHISVRWHSTYKQTNVCEEWYDGKVVRVVVHDGGVWHKVKYAGDVFWHKLDQLIRSNVGRIPTIKTGSRVCVEWVLEDGSKQICRGVVKRVQKRTRGKYYCVEYDGEEHWHRLHDKLAEGGCRVRDGDSFEK